MNLKCTGQMKINILSDLHSEFWPSSGCPFEIPTGEVLVLAGDICQASDCREGFLIKNLENFFEKCSENFEIVLYVMGNHEHFSGDINTSEDIICKALVKFKNIHLLENQYVEHNEVLFLGATLWTDFNKEDPLTMFDVSSCMRDYNVIQDSSTGNHKRKLGTTKILEKHKDSLEFIKKHCSSNFSAGYPKVIISHHAPSERSIVPEYKQDYRMNGAYKSDLDEMFVEYPEIKLWIHGHMHSSLEYNIENAKVVCNPYGYYGHDTNKEFNCNKFVEVL